MQLHEPSAPVWHPQTGEETCSREIWRDCSASTNSEFEGLVVKIRCKGGNPPRMACNIDVQYDAKDNLMMKLGVEFLVRLIFFLNMYFYPECCLMAC